MRTSTQHILPRTLLGTLLAAGLALLWLGSASAAPPPDPYADAVQSSSNFALPANALGAPDGNSATSIVNLSPSTLVLDMGAGEEGTGNLRLHYSVALGLNVNVAFLDSGMNVLHSQSVALALLSSNVTIPYPAAPTPYRYVRITVGATLLLNVDAVEALSYVTPVPTDTPSLTPSETLTPSLTPSETLTPSLTPSETLTPSLTPSETSTPSLTPSETLTPSLTPSETPTPSLTPSETLTPSLTPSETPTPSLTPSETLTPSLTPTETLTPSLTPSETLTPSLTPSETPNSYDAFADAVLSTSGGVSDASLALGAPDGMCASMLGALFLDAVLTLDMGAGEHGQGDLLVYYQGNVLGIGAAALPTVEFLDETQALIATAPLPLLQLVLGSTEAIYTYPSAPADYRYVRLRSGLLSLVCIDAVEALPYLAPTATLSPSQTFTATFTHTSSPTATETPTPTASLTPTETFTATLTASPTVTPSTTPIIYEPYAAAVYSSSGSVSNASNAIGAPDGMCASMLGALFLDAVLTLDMGAGQLEQTDLLVYYQGNVLGLGAALLPTVEFLDEAHNLIATAPSPLLQLVLGDTQAHYGYTGAPASYRYVRLSSDLLSLLCVDAVEAQTAAATATPTETSSPTPTPTPTSTETLTPQPPTATDTPVASSTPMGALLLSGSGVLPSVTATRPASTATAVLVFSLPTNTNTASLPATTSSPQPIDTQVPVQPTAAVLAEAHAASELQAASVLFTTGGISSNSVAGNWLGYLPWLLLSLLALAAPGVLMAISPRLRVAFTHPREGYGLELIEGLGIARRTGLNLQEAVPRTPSRAVAEFLRGDTDVLLASLLEVADLAESGVELTIIYAHACASQSLRMPQALRVMVVLPQTLKSKRAQCSRLVQAWAAMAATVEANPAGQAEQLVLLGGTANRRLLVEQGGIRMQHLLSTSVGRQLPGQRLRALYTASLVS